MKATSLILGITLCALVGGCPPRADKPTDPTTRQDKDPAEEQDGKVVLTPNDVGHFDPTEVKAERKSPVMFEERTKGLPTKGNWKSDPVFVDVNKDGKLDLAALSRMGEGPQVWLGDGGESWTLSSKGLQYGTECCGGGLSFGDINQDGHLDLAIGDHCHGGWIYFGDGKGNWELITQRLYPAEMSGGKDRDSYLGAEDLDMGDLNGDGQLDLVMIASDEGGVNVFLGDGRGTLESWKWHDSGLPKREWGTRTGFLDVNGDGWMDVVAAFFSGPRVWLGDGQGGLTESSQGLPKPIYGGFYHGFAQGDFNSDGLSDLVFANWSDGPEVYLQQTDASWKQAPKVFKEMKGGAYGVDAGDMDGDGHLDLVVTGRLPRDVGYIYGVYLLMGDGKGNFTWVDGNNLPTHGMASNYGVKLADINADGRLDVAVCSGGMVASPSKPNSATKPSPDARLLVWLNRAR